MSTIKYYRRPLDWEKEDQYLMPWDERAYETRIVGQDSRISRIRKNSVRGKALVQRIKKNCLNEIIVMVVQMTAGYSWADRAAIIEKLTEKKMSSESIRKRYERYSKNFKEVTHMDTLHFYNIEPEMDEHYCGIHEYSMRDYIVRYICENDIKKIRATIGDTVDLIYIAERCKRFSWEVKREIYNDLHLYCFDSTDAMKKAYSLAKKRLKTDVELQEALDNNKNYQDFLSNNRNDIVSRCELLKPYRKSVLKPKDQ